jgi:Immunoglobulin-like domain of bacterial spore germination/Sporulation and spore germination
VLLRGVVLLGCVALLAGCGGKQHAAQTTTSQTTTTAKTIPLAVYFYRGAALVPTVVHVPQTQAVGTSAIESLLAGPPSGYTTALPAHAQLLGLSIVGGIATARFDSSLAGLPRTGQAQLVYTLTQFASVRGVEAQAGSAPLTFQDGSDLPLTVPATRDDFADLTPLAPIFVSAPLRDSTVSSPVQASGTANVPEATIQVDVWSGSRKLATRTITATLGSPNRGTWKSTFVLPPGPARLDFYEPSQENGAHLHETVVNLTVGS